MKSIILTLLDADDRVQPAGLENIFRQEDFEAQVVLASEVSAQPLCNLFNAGVVLFSSFNSEQVDKAVRETSALIQASDDGCRPLIACSKGLNAKDNKELRKWGVNKVIQPELWETNAIAERILAALYGGFLVYENGEAREFLVAFEDDRKPYITCNAPFKSTDVERKMIGATKVMQTLFSAIKRCSRYSHPVLIRGETGTGKELVAAAIHHTNPKKRSKKYIAINIAGIESELVANELFGHVKGGFTGSITRKLGSLVEAEDGTVFIDEVGDLREVAQLKLLRVIEDREVHPIGGADKDTVALEARLLFATNQPLEEMFGNKKKKFREDLYYRMARGETLILPPLRKRKADLELLAKDIFNCWNAERSKDDKPDELPDLQQPEGVLVLNQKDYDEIVDLCIKHEFRGNVRDLIGVLERCFRNSLEDRRFDIEHLRVELSDKTETEQYKNQGEEENMFLARQAPVSSSHETSDGQPGAVPTSKQFMVPFDPYKDTYKDFKKRALKIYATEVFLAADKDITTALEISGIKVKSTFYGYKDEKVRKRKKRVPKTNSENNNDED